jgi:hypothetical protein
MAQRQVDGVRPARLLTLLPMGEGRRRTFSFGFDVRSGFELQRNVRLFKINRPLPQAVLTAPSLLRSYLAHAKHVVRLTYPLY